MCGPTWITGSVIHNGLKLATGRLQVGNVCQILMEWFQNRRMVNFIAKWLIAEL